MSRTGAEEKPPWSAVPARVKDRVADILGAPVARAERVYGGYAPSATFRLLLKSGERAFFKASYPLPKTSGVEWVIHDEIRNYRTLERFMRPWSPAYLGSFASDGWEVLLLEDVGPRSVPPWTPAKARHAARSYALFHKRTVGKTLPRSLKRDPYLAHTRFWRTLREKRRLGDVASLAHARSDDAREWLDVALPVFIEHEIRLERTGPPFALLHFDTRSDNVRLHRDKLRIFDWPFASLGPAEFDVVAFCQGVEAEAGPSVDRILEWYEEVLPLRREIVDASLAGIAGYFADRSPRPPVEGLPRLRRWQRAQLRVCLAWAARRFALAEPRWLARVRV